MDHRLQDGLIERVVECVEGPIRGFPGIVGIAGEGGGGRASGGNEDGRRGDRRPNTEKRPARQAHAGAMAVALTDGRGEGDRCHARCSHRFTPAPAVEGGRQCRHGMSQNLAARAPGVSRAVSERRCDTDCYGFSCRRRGGQALAHGCIPTRTRRRPPPGVPQAARGPSRRCVGVAGPSSGSISQCSSGWCSARNTRSLRRSTIQPGERCFASAVNQAVPLDERAVKAPGRSAQGDFTLPRHFPTGWFCVDSRLRGNDGNQTVRHKSSFPRKRESTRDV